MKAQIRLINQAKEEYENLTSVVETEKAKGIKSSENQTLLKSIKEKIDLLKNNPLYGEVVKKRTFQKT